MKNLVLTFLLAVLVVLTAVSVRRMVAGTATSQDKAGVGCYWRVPCSAARRRRSPGGRSAKFARFLRIA